jgi:hypothetical protein
LFPLTNTHMHTHAYKQANVILTLFTDKELGI